MLSFVMVNVVMHSVIQHNDTQHSKENAAFGINDTQNLESQC
jgi:hypothetical protein